MGAEALVRLARCRDCAWYRPAGAPRCTTCTEWIDADIEAAWVGQLRELGVVAEHDERDLAEAVVNDPRGVPWRIVDAAMLRIPCSACGLPSGAGPAACASCRLSHGYRFLAAEPDRPCVPAGNEHAIRVSTVVARRSQWFPAHMVPLYASTLPLLLAGDMPTTSQAQAVKAWINRGGDIKVLADATSFAEVHARVVAG